jgi:hypothetical protein
MISWYKDGIWSAIGPHMAEVAGNQIWRPVQGAFVILAGPVHLVTTNTANAMIDA